MSLLGHTANVSLKFGCHVCRTISQCYIKIYVNSCRCISNKTLMSKIAFRGQFSSNFNIPVNIVPLGTTCSNFETSSKCSDDTNAVYLISQYLKSVLQEFENLSKQSSNRPANLSRLKFLKPIADALRNIDRYTKEKLEIESMLKGVERDDHQLLSMAQTEISSYRDKVTSLQNTVIDYLTGNPIDDERDAILEVTAGVGGQEAMLFAQDLYHMYQSYAALRGYQSICAAYDGTTLGGLRYGSMRLTGSKVYGQLRYEGGIHRVQRIPLTDKSGRVHTSTVAVAVLPQPHDIDVVLDAKDLKIETCRASGKGGQSVNKTDSAVRIVHIPTGTSAESQVERHQYENRAIAMAVLRSRLYQQQRETVKSDQENRRKVQVGTLERSDKIRTYNFLQDRVTDHRIGRNCHNLPVFLQGRDLLDEMITCVHKKARDERLAEILQTYQQSSKRDVER